MLFPFVIFSAVAAAKPLDSHNKASTDLRVIVISDLNGQYGTTEYGKYVHHAVDHIIAQSPDLVLITGDMVAGQKANLPYKEMWAAFHEAVTIPLQQANIPLAITPGNHDASAYKNYSKEREIFAQSWQSHRPDFTFVDDTHFPFRYAFLFDDTLFVSLDDTRSGPLDSEQELWLDSVLNTEATNKIVFGHLPLYPFSQGRENQVIGDPYIENLMNKHGVNMFISGHHHSYYPGKRNQLLMVSSPCLGAGPRKLMNSDSRSKRGMVGFSIVDGEIEDLHGWTGYKFDRTIERETLPKYVGSTEFPIWRDDLSEQDFVELLQVLNSTDRLHPFLPAAHNTQ